MNKKGNVILGILILIIAIIFAVIVVDLQTTRTFVPGIKDLLTGPSTDFLKNFNPFTIISDLWANVDSITYGDVKDTSKNFLGFNFSPQRFFADFALGLFAGLWIWIVYTINKYWRFIIGKDKAYKKDEELVERKTRWLGMVAGRIWKTIFIGIGFAALMQVPIINRGLQILTLEIIGVGFFGRSLMLALELGYLPAFIENLRKNMFKNKLERKAREAEIGASTTRAAGRRKPIKK